MKTWAEKRKREMERLGATELAEMFDLVIKICVQDEELPVVRTRSIDPRFNSQLVDELG
jgi:hypothetical protein